MHRVISINEHLEQYFALLNLNLPQTNFDAFICEHQIVHKIFCVLTFEVSTACFLLKKSLFASDCKLEGNQGKFFASDCKLEGHQGQH